MKEGELRLEVRKVLNEWSENNWKAIETMMTPKESDCDSKEEEEPVTEE